MEIVLPPRFLRGGCVGSRSFPHESLPSMDLPVCPSCKQSVLDENPEFCPFCGASMTGKGGKAKAAAQPAAKSAAPAAAGAKAGAAKPSAAKAAADDPFEIEAHAGEAIAASPKRAAGKTLAVKCPMCETVGYVPPSAAGKDVRCANPQCMMPVFTAQKPEAPPPAPVVAKKQAAAGINWPLIGAITGVCVVGSVGAYFIFGTPQDTAPAVIGLETLNNLPEAKNASPATNPNTKVTQAEKPGIKEKSASNGNPTPAPAPGGQLVKDILDTIVASALTSDNNRHKGYCRRLTGIAFAVAGDAAGTSEQLVALDNVGREVPHYRIPALVTLAWRQLSEGNSADAANAVEQAWQSAGSIPKFGRDAQQIALELAAILPAVGRADDAHKLLADHPVDAHLGNVAVRISLVRHTRSFDVDTAPPADLIGGWTAPQAVGVTAILALHGAVDEAKQWATSQPDETAKDECVTAWADVLVRRALAGQKPDLSGNIPPVSAELSPAAQTRLWACLAQTRLAAGDKPEAENDLNSARTAAAQFAAPPATNVESFQHVIDIELPPAVEIRAWVLGAAECARAEARLGQTERAQASLQQALTAARGIAPSPAGVAAQKEAVKAAGANSVREELKSLYNLKTDDEARRKYTQLSRKLLELEKAAADRLALQVEVLSSAAAAGLTDAVAHEITVREAEEDPSAREPYLDTPLPWRVLAALKSAGQTANVGELTALVGERKPNDDPYHRLVEETSPIAAAGDARALAEAINQAGNDPGVDLWALQGASRLFRAKGVQAVLDYSATLKNQVLQEESLWLAGAQSARNGQAAQTWALIREQPRLSQTKKISAALGVLEGRKPDASE